MKDWSKQTVVQLKAELKRRGLGQAGLKQELVTRLTEDDASKTAEATPEVTPDADSTANSESADSPEAQVEPAPVDDAPNDAPSTETGPAAEVTTQSSTEAIDEPANAPLETDQHDAPPAVPETLNAAEVTPPAPVDAAQDAQKRKRRSESPVESSPDIARKRVKADTGDGSQSPKPSGVTGVIGKITETLTQNTSLVDDIAKDAKDIAEQLPKPSKDEVMEEDKPPTSPTEASNKDVVMTASTEDQTEAQDAEQAADVSMVDEARDAENTFGGTTDPVKEAPVTTEAEQRASAPRDVDDAMEYDRDVRPAVHPATRALYIKNFMRPLRDSAVQDHLLHLATPAGAQSNDDDIEDFYLDQIRTHAFAVFRTTTQASRVRNALHEVIWPDERERKPLRVDFVPPEKVPEWIDEERAQGARQRGCRWEVLYDRDDDGYVVARLDSGTAPPPALAAPEPARLAPSGPAVKDVNAIPLGPRGGRGIDGVPLGPRGDAPRGPGGRPPRQIPGFPGGLIQTTKTNPPISYQPVSEDLASRRVRNMRSYYTQDLKRDMGPETDINRYTFEQGDNFVDRGQEVFVGIRPPHREAQRRRPGGTGGGPPRGPPGRGRRSGNRRGPRPLSDRYLPGINESGPYRQGDRGNYDRRDDRRY
ncbi:hypothetical protein C8034_v005435 [Colletotrichum sidae]|uniref:SAP domain-containing protein n=1 Tax=Colletotrichum sidae TaxID=1347389 RepID=A0A4V3I479_9PEZI|nr:hypothetical protein C8034_v005435 [Colletotrichum sidae]